jgi:hypothetical protein
MAREALLVRTLVEMADSLVDDFDVVALLTVLADRCVEVLEVEAAGVMLVAPEGKLRVVASSTEAVRMVELFELQADEGPCLDCYRTGAPVLVAEDLAAAGGRWPRFAPVAAAAGFRSAHALPLRLRGSTIGALNLFGSQGVPLSAADATVGQALADVATIAILQQRMVSDSRILVDQLNTALTSRVVIEQAKGVLGERAGLPLESAFDHMRAYARKHYLRLSDVACRVVERSLGPAELRAGG